MTVILLKIKLTGNRLLWLSKNCLWRYDQLSHASLLMIFYIILIIVALKQRLDSSLHQHQNKQQRRRGKRDREFRLYMLISKRLHIPEKSCNDTPSLYGCITEVHFGCPRQEQTKTCLQTSAPRAWVDGWDWPPS